MNKFTYQVNRVQPLTDRVLQLFIEPADQNNCHYIAGQYIELEISTGERRPFSIANAPLGGKCLEFHIRHVADDEFTQQLHNDCGNNCNITLHGPLGSCTLQNRCQEPHIFIAGGTGFAPIKAILEDLLSRDPCPPIHLFWGASNASDLYLNALPLQWQQHIPKFQYTPVLTQAADDWHGETGVLPDVVMQHYPMLAQQVVVVQGPFQLALTLRERMCAAGLPTQNIMSDAFIFDGS